MNRRKIIRYFGDIYCSFGVLVKLLYQGIGCIKGCVFIKLEVLPIDGPHITAISQSLDVVFQSRQLKVLALVKRKNGDTVVQLHGVGIGRVIH